MSSIAVDVQEASFPDILYSSCPHASTPTSIKLSTNDKD